MRLPGLLLTSLLALLSASSHADQDDEVRPAPDSEGPLQSDAFLPTDTAAAADLEHGDARLARARAARGTNDAQRLYGEAFDAWHRPLQQPGAGLASTWAGAEGSEGPRLSEGLREGVERRLDLLDADELARWRVRFDPAARAALVAAGSDPAALAGVELGFPRTEAAARAALRLGDRALESGRTGRALLWLERARRAGADVGEGELARALGRRETLVLGLPPAPAGPGPGARTGGEGDWRTARTLSATGALPLVHGRIRSGDRAAAGPVGGVRLGLAFLPDGRIAVQTAEAIRILRPGRDGGLEPESGFELGALLAGSPFSPEPDEGASRRAPGWALLPATQDGDLFCVHGRSLGEPNVLVCVRPPAARDGREPGAGATSAQRFLAGDQDVPRLLWAVAGARRFDASEGGGAVRPIEELADLEELELQPGPVVAGDHVVVQARSYEGPVEAWLLAFDRFTGELDWRLLLGSGSDLLRDVGRLDTGWLPRLAAQPLLVPAGGTHVFAGTNLGSGVLASALDGRPAWSLKSRRRLPEDAGWPGDRPLASTEGGGAILWAPFDSDRLYALPPGPLAGPGAADLLLAPPLAREESIAPLGGTPSAVLVQGRAGPERTVSIRGPAGTDRRDALYLGAEERFAGRGLVSPARVLVGTDRGVYLFDRERELYLLDYASIEQASPRTNGGDLYALGELVLALGRDTIWSFRAR